MALIPGTTLGTYEIVSLLGAGGMGEVYRARDGRLGREVALKVLPEAMSQDLDRLARFEREARTVAGLNHPNIVTLYSLEEESGTRFITMELVEGECLDGHVVPGGLPLARILDFAIPLADALVAAHRKAVVHRDLKPANVMVTREGRIKVLDFGLAKLAQPDSSADMTRTLTRWAPLSEFGQVVGTIPYMAPEQLRGEKVDPRWDLFSLGVIVYELAAGKRPFEGATLVDIGSAILRDSPTPLTSLRPDLPVELERIVGRCLEKSSRDRYQTSLAVHSDLRGMRQEWDTAPAAPARRPVFQPPQPIPVASIAVLPFVNRSHSVEDEYFSDGLADELLNVLAKIRGLRVAARTSAFQFKGKNEDLAVIGAKLNVATVLDGSVRKVGNRVRIAVQLVNVSDGFHLWSQSYDRTLEDIFVVQDDIAQSVVKELRATLLGEDPDSRASVQVKVEVAKAVRGRGGDPEAQRLCLQGRHFTDRHTRDDSEKGIAYVQQALELDPGYALAWTELGRAYARQADFGWVPVDEGYDRARKAVEHALSLEPELAEAHARLGWIRMTHEWDWHGAQASFQRAMELAPGSAAVLGVAGVLACGLGHPEEAIDPSRRAVELDPLSATANATLGIAYHLAGHLEEAERTLRMAVELAPQRVMSRSRLAMVLKDLERWDEALAEAMLEPYEGVRLWALAIIHHAAGRPADSDEALQLLTQSFGDDFAYQIAEVHAARGEADMAFEWLERAYAVRDSGLLSMKASPHCRSLHDDPRWMPFSRKMGFQA